MIRSVKTFSGGVHVPDYKIATCNLPIENLPLPEEVVIPVVGYGFKSQEILVNVGDRVKTGQIIAETKRFISSPIHASISGEVTKIADFPHPELGKAKGILIQSDKKDEKDFDFRQRDYENLSSNEIKNIIKDAGIVGLGGAAFPTHVKFTIPEDKKVDAYIINLCECEPYLTCDYRIALERTDEILKGINIGLKSLGAESAFIGIENNKKDAIGLFNKKSTNYPNIEIIPLKTKYPQGDEKQLIKAVLGRIVPKGKLPLDIGVVVNNIQTVVAIYEAVSFGKPLYERVITITGKGVKRPKNIKVRIGTLLDDIIKGCGGIIHDEVEIIFGGPMMGLVQTDLKTPILAGTSAILALPKYEIDLQEELPCIRCAKCVDVCPARLMPFELDKAAKNKNWDLLDELNISECIECGACSYICPSKIPIVRRIKQAKITLAKRKKK